MVKRVIVIFFFGCLMKITKNKAASTVFNFVNDEALLIAKKFGMKEAVHLFEAALISCAAREEEWNYSSAARNMHIPVTTLGSRKESLKKHVAKMDKLK